MRKATRKQTRALIESLILNVWEGSQVSAADQILCPDCLDRFDNETIRGISSIKEFSAATQIGIPDIHFVIDDIQVSSDHAVAARWHAEGTHLGILQGLPPTGLPVTYWGITLWRFAEGKVAESWTVSTRPQAFESLRRTVEEG